MIGTTGRSGGHDPQAASDLASVGETLEELYHDAPCGYISSLPDGRIVRVNETFLRWTGYEEDALLGRRLQDLLTPGGRIYHETHYAPLLRMQGSVREIALDLLCADGRTLPVLMNSVLRVDERGEPALVRTVVLDATERRGYERELLRARDEAEQAEHRAQELARTLQASLIPPGPPQIPGLDVAAIYRPAGDGAEVGGDFFDVFPLDDSTWGITIGDVEGKGVEAAALTAFVRYTLRAAAVQNRRPAEVLRTLNRALRMDRSERFSTAIFATVDLASAPGQPLEIRLAAAGHPLPVVARADEAPELFGEPGTLLGVIDDPVQTELVLHLERGDAVVFYTDGVTEGRGGGAFYGERRLLETIATHRDTDAGTLVEGIVGDVLAFQGDVPRDDIVVVGLRIPPLASAAVGTISATATIHDDDA